MTVKIEIKCHRSFNVEKRRWTTPSVIVLKEASKSELLLAGPIDDGGFLTS